MRHINFIRANESLNYFNHAEKNSATHFTHSLFSSGDYCGSQVEASNRQALLKNTELVERLGIIELNEAYSTDSLLFPIASLEDSELKEIFEDLENYPCLDENLMSEIETDLENECLDCFGLNDFKTHLVETLDESFHDKIENLTNGQLKELYFNASRLTNYNVFEVESGTSGYFNFKSFGGIYEKQKDIFINELQKLEVVK